MKSEKPPTLDAVTKSLPVRGAWIEIIAEPLHGVEQVVAPRAGSVD